MDHKNKRIFFVSEIRSTNSQANSTHIMTLSLLQGIKKNGNNIIFFAICEYLNEIKEIIKEYSELVDIIIPLPSNFNYELNKYYRLGLMLYYSYFIGYYRKQLNKVESLIKFNPDLIISHAPSIEGICYGRALKEKYTNINYFQYWSDPIALSGITPDMLSIKRFPFKHLESRALSYADKIIYGTKPLMQFQKKLFPKMSNKMYYIDIPYINKSVDYRKFEKGTVLYAGNFFSSLRNINPLIEAIESMEGYHLDIYGDGNCLNHIFKHCKLHGRIPASDLKNIEMSYEYLICILNHSCIQIPGKIFYDMARPVKIIVIADGKYQKIICDYLSGFRRFLVCQNTPEDIAKKITDSRNISVDLSLIKEKYSPEKICSDLLSGGLNENYRNK